MPRVRRRARKASRRSDRPRPGLGIALPWREDRAVFGGGYVEELSGTFVMARDASADGDVGAAINQQLGDFGGRSG